MDDRDIMEQLAEIMRDVFDDDSIVASDSMTAKDVIGWDSLGHVRLMVAIEEHFTIHFTTAEISEMRNVGELKALIAAKAGQRGRG